MKDILTWRQINKGTRARNKRNSVGWKLVAVPQVLELPYARRVMQCRQRTRGSDQCFLAFVGFGFRKVNTPTSLLPLSLISTRPCSKGSINTST